MNETLTESHRRNYGECLERERVQLLTIGALQEENRDLIYALERFVDAARSWHNFHKHVEGIHCDAICDAIAPARCVLEARHAIS